MNTLARPPSTPSARWLLRVRARALRTSWWPPANVESSAEINYLQAAATRCIKFWVYVSSSCASFNCPVARIHTSPSLLYFADLRNLSELASAWSLFAWHIQCRSLKRARARSRIMTVVAVCVFFLSTKEGVLRLGATRTTRSSLYIVAGIVYCSRAHQPSGDTIALAVISHENDTLLPICI